VTWQRFTLREPRLRTIKKRRCALNTEAAALQSQFQQRLLAAVKSAVWWWITLISSQGLATMR
jgi:peptidyl-dipeptidase Dcp